MKNIFHKLIIEVLLSILIAILLTKIGIIFWLYSEEEKTIYTLILGVLIIMLVIVVYLYFLKCMLSTELIVLKLINKSTNFEDVIQNILKANLSTKVEVIWYKETRTEVEEYNSSLERYETVIKNIEDILHKEIIEEIYITEDKTEIFNFNKEKEFTLVYIEEEFRFDRDIIKRIGQKIQLMDRLYKDKSSRKKIKYNIALTTDYDTILLNKNVSKVHWWNKYGKIFYWLFSVLLLNVPYRIWLNKYFNSDKLVIKKIGKEILG